MNSRYHQHHNPDYSIIILFAVRRKGTDVAQKKQLDTILIILGHKYKYMTMIVIITLLSSSSLAGPPAAGLRDSQSDSVSQF